MGDFHQPDPGAETGYHFQKLNFRQKRRLSLEQLILYYRAERKYRYEANEPVKGIRLRKRVHWIIVKGVKLDKLISKRRVTLVRDDRCRTDAPKIYAVSHVGRWDIESFIETSDDDAFLVWGDPDEGYRKLDALFLNLNGVVCVDTDAAEDRHICKATCIKILKAGGNIWIYPEGAWNITPNLLIQKLYTGAVEMAIESGAEIIPVAIDADGKNYSVSIGRNISYQGITMEQKYRKTDELRDIMCTMEWELIERKGISPRESLPENMAQQYEDSIMKYTENGYTVEVIKRSRFHAKNESGVEDVFAFLADVQPSAENSFLFRQMESTIRKVQSHNLCSRE